MVCLKSLSKLKHCHRIALTRGQEALQALGEIIDMKHVIESQLLIKYQILTFMLTINQNYDVTSQVFV